MIRSWQPFLSRVALLAMSLVTLFLLTGCEAPYGTLYGDAPGFPGSRFGIDPLYFLVGFIFFALLGPAITIVALGVLLPFIFPPAYRIRIGGMTIELWESRRRYPLVSMAQALIVPVMPDLKMVFGAAKMARDRGAGKVQVEASKVAPLAPGEAFVGPGARYLYRYTALAVIFDEQKRTTPELMTRGLRRTMELLSQEDHVSSVIVPDMTETLLAQPNQITEEAGQKTAHQTARLMLESLLACHDLMKTVKIWVWNPDNTDAFIAEMERLEEEEDEKRASATTRTHAA
jgi:hypothetical protein